MARWIDKDDVFDASGLTWEFIKDYSDRHSDEDDVTNLINSYIDSAQAKIEGLLQIPHVVHRERHLGTGEDDEFQLGPEDEEIYINYESEDCVELVKACYFKRYRMKLPYPKDCDSITDDKTLWDSTGYVLPDNESTIKQAGNYSMKFTFTAGNLDARYPDVSGDNYIQKNIDIFDFLFFRVQSNTNNIEFTIYLYSDDATKYSYATYTISKKGKWYKVMLHIDDDFTEVGGLDWDDDELYYIVIEVDEPCIIYLDNLNFNDEWCFTAPSGKLVIMRKSSNEPPASNYPFYVTYTYDPFKVTVLENIKEACAQFAGAKLISFLLGLRERDTAFDVEAETGMRLPDRETLHHRRGSLIARAKENLASYGYGYVQGGMTI